MRTFNARQVIAAGAALAAASLVLTACSSDPEPTTTASALPSATAAPSASESASASAVATGPAALACTAYFDLDLLNSAYAGGAVADGDLTEEQVREDFEAQLKELTAQAKAAVADGSADRKMVVNAKRMKKIVNSLDEGQALADLSKQKQTRFAKSSLRVQKACDRAGFPLPQDNLTARTAAGL
jgi:hypothetical protein